MKYFAVNIGGEWTSDSPLNEAVFNCKNKTEARRCGKRYIRAWALQKDGEDIRYIREITDAEYNERVNDRENYMRNGYLKYRIGNWKLT